MDRLNCKNFEKEIAPFFADDLENEELEAFLAHTDCCKDCREEEDCCKACGLFISDDEPSEESVADAANTETPTTGATPEDTADGETAATATDSEAPAENKEESKSDGCSMLFI